jgi:hypothetical protein
VDLTAPTLELFTVILICELFIHPLPSSTHLSQMIEERSSLSSHYSFPNFTSFIFFRASSSNFLTMLRPVEGTLPLTEECHHYDDIQDVPWDLQK